MVEIVPATSSGRGDPIGEEADNGVIVERREKFSAVCKWQIREFSKMKQRTTRCLYSKYFEVGGFDCRLLVYPAGPFPFALIHNSCSASPSESLLPSNSIQGMGLGQLVFIDSAQSRSTRWARQNYQLCLFTLPPIMSP